MRAKALMWVIVAGCFSHEAARPPEELRPVEGSAAKPPPRGSPALSAPVLRPRAAPTMSVAEAYDFLYELERKSIPLELARTDKTSDVEVNAKVAHELASICIDHEAVCAHGCELAYTEIVDPLSLFGHQGRPYPCDGAVLSPAERALHVERRVMATAEVAAKVLDPESVARLRCALGRAGLGPLSENCEAIALAEAMHTAYSVHRDAGDLRMPMLALACGEYRMCAGPCQKVLQGAYGMHPVALQRHIAEDTQCQVPPQVLKGNPSKQSAAFQRWGASLLAAWFEKGARSQGSPLAEPLRCVAGAIRQARPSAKETCTLPAPPERADTWEEARAAKIRRIPAASWPPLSSSQENGVDLTSLFTDARSQTELLRLFARACAAKPGCAADCTWSLAQFAEDRQTQTTCEALGGDPTDSAALRAGVLARLVAVAKNTPAHALGWSGCTALKDGLRAFDIAVAWEESASCATDSQAR